MQSDRASEYSEIDQVNSGEEWRNGVLPPQSPQECSSKAINSADQVISLHLTNFCCGSILKVLAECMVSSLQCCADSSFQTVCYDL